MAENENEQVKEFLLMDGGGGGKGGRVVGLGNAKSELLEAGVIGLESAGGRGGRVRLGVGEEEVRGALRGDGEGRGLGFG